MFDGVPNNQIAFVLIPGFAPDNYPVLALRDELSGMGYHVVAINFWGKEENVEFDKLTANDCKSGIARVLEEVSREYKIVIGIGISLGGALLLEHAKENDNLDYIVSVGTPFKLKNKVIIFFGFLLYPLFYLLWSVAVSINMRPVPVPSAREMINFMNIDFIKNLEKIKTPILLLHSKHDYVVDVSAVPKYVEMIGSASKKVIYFENVDHTIGYDNEIMIKSIKEFLAEHN